MVKVYKADPNIRDNSGKRPRQYMMAHDQVFKSLRWTVRVIAISISRDLMTTPPLPRTELSFKVLNLNKSAWLNADSFIGSSSPTSYF